jgi:hypothetical protein
MSPSVIESHQNLDSGSSGFNRGYQIGCDIPNGPRFHPRSTGRWVHWLLTIERKSVQSSGVQSGHRCPFEVSGIHGNSGELTPWNFPMSESFGNGWKFHTILTHPGWGSCLGFGRIGVVWGDWGSREDW